MPEMTLPPGRVERLGAGRASSVPLGRWLRLAMGMARADLKSESARTYVGFLWWFVEPTIAMGVYYVVFELVLQRGTGNYVAFLFTGLVPWRWFSTALVHGANSVVMGRHLMQQVHVPKLVFPLVAILTDTFKFLLVMILLLVYLLATGAPMGSSLLALPVVLLVQGLFTAGLTTVAALVTPFLPDIRVVLDSLVRFWFFLSGVFFVIGDLPDGPRQIFRLNPMAVILEGYRDILLHGSWPNATHLGLVTVLSVLLLVVALRLGRRWEYVYPKLVL